MRIILWAIVVVLLFVSLYHTYINWLLYGVVYYREEVSFIPYE
jgi:hypothetical protein